MAVGVRKFYLFAGITALFILFYLRSPSTISSRLADGSGSTTPIKGGPGMTLYAPAHVEPASDLISGDANPLDLSSGPETALIPSAPAVDDDKFWDAGKLYFQEDMPFYSNPKFSSAKLRRHTPHNYKGPGHPTFATYLSTRNGSMHDPYFLAAQQVAYRLLWDPRSRYAFPALSIVHSGWLTLPTGLRSFPSPFLWRLSSPMSNAIFSLQQAPWCGRLILFHGILPHKQMQGGETFSLN